MVVVMLCLAVSGCAQPKHDWDCDEEASHCVDRNSGETCDYPAGYSGTDTVNTQCDMIAGKIPPNIESSVGRSKSYFGSSGGAMIWRLNNIIDSMTIGPILELLMDEKDFRPEFRWRGGGTSNAPVEGTHSATLKILLFPAESRGDQKDGQRYLPTRPIWECLAPEAC
jgi:hypothetical protein